MESTEYQLVSTDVNWEKINKVTRLFFAEKFPHNIMFQIKKKLHGQNRVKVTSKNKLLIRATHRLTLFINCFISLDCQDKIEKLAF